MNSGQQAMLAASQQASAEQRQSFLDALAFAKEQYAQQRQDRSPYMGAGTSALQMWTNLLGLQPGLVDGGGGGGGGSTPGTLRAIATNGSTGSNSGSSGSSRGSGGSTPPPVDPVYQGNKGVYPTYPGPEFRYGPGFERGYEPPFPYVDWTKLGAPPPLPPPGTVPPWK